MIRINVRWRPYIQAAALMIGFMAILGSLVTLPPTIGFPAAVAAATLTWIARRIIYQQRTIWVYPGPSSELARSWLGTLWKEPDRDDVGIHELGILFESRLAAQHMFQLLRAWTGGVYRDPRGDIRVSAIRESPTRYTIVIYPGPRLWARNAISNRLRAALPQDVENVIGRHIPYFKICADYGGNDRMRRTLSRIAGQPELQLNTYYVRTEEIIPYSRRTIRTNGHRLVDRTALLPTELEFGLTWSDPRTTDPVKYARAKSLEDRAIQARDA